jgi:hypothetical protein
MTVKKGLLVGVAVGGLLYVMWRRSRTAEPPPEPAAAWEPAVAPMPDPPPPEPVAEEPIADEPAAAGLVADEPVAEEPRDEAPEVATVVPIRAEEPALHHPGRRVRLSSTGFASRPRPAVFRGTERPQPVRVRATWPGVAGAGQARPKPPRLVPTRARPAALRRSR